MNRYLKDAPYHLCHVVPDLAAAVDRLLASGFGPAFFFHSVTVEARYRGQRNQIQLSAAFVCVGETLVELLQQENDAASAYREFLARHPGGGLHHIAYISADFAQSLREVKANGLELQPVEEFLGEDGESFETYYEPVGQADPVYIQLALPGPLDNVFTAIRRISQAWDGTEPKRDILTLFPEVAPATSTTLHVD